MASSSSPSSSSRSCNYDVFLSFRGEDTRKTFVDHLYTSLANRMIFTYKDDETLARGERIRSSLFNAIEGSRIAVIIFSKNYADSSWCLEELTHIMRCCKDEGKLTVIPIFYGVVPSDVRKQEGDFGIGFAKQADKAKAVGNINNKVEIWRKALFDACEIAGWETNTTANGHESKAIIEIVDKISNMLFPITSVVDEDLVGMRTHMQELEAQIEIGSDGVRMIGIWGVGGSGKTTLASYISRKISRYFDGHCTLENIREESKEHGLKPLQKKIISRLLKKEMDIQDVDEGKSMISRLSRSNVLVILDDVDDIKQLDALAGSPHWFGNGSRIIITTRNKHLLTTHKVDHIYPIRLLSHDEAIQLFNKRAYNEKKPLKDYETLSQQAVSYTARLPLALKVLSSFMYDKDEKEWRSTLDRLKHTPHTEIFEHLKISYDGLESEEKEIFLDIACFFRRWSVDSAIEILEACGYHHDIGIKVLREKALIAIVDGKLDMHDLIQEMGHYVVRKEYPNDPEKHSRVWKPEEIENMCRGDATTENDRTKGLYFTCLHDGYSSLFCKYVSNMRKLRYLNVTTFRIEDKGPSFLSNELCYMKWRGYPGSLFPYSFKPIKLVTLKLYNSMQKKLWKGYKHLPNLKVLVLERMENLHSTPNFDQLPSLQKLVLDDCERLKKIHPSLGDHKSLEYISVSSCDKLKMFPKIVQMEKLKTLKLQFFSHQQVEFPVIKSNMRSLVEIYLESMGIDALLSSIGERCTNLISVELKHCHLKNNEANFVGLRHLEKLGLSRLAYRNKVESEKHIRPMSVFPQFAHLRKLNLGYCGLRDGEMPSDIGEIITLEELDLSGNYFTRLDFCLSQLTRLKVLILSHCEWLVELSQLPSGIIIFNADYCRSLTIVEDLYTNCKCLCDVSLQGMRITNDGYRLLESMLQGTTIENHCMVLRLQSHEIAKGFKPPLLRGRYYTLKLPEYWCNNFSGFLMCGVGFKSQTIRIRITVVKSGINHHNDVVWKESDHDDEFHTCVWYLSFASLRHTGWWDETHQEVLFYVDDEDFKSDDDEDFESDQWSGFGVRLVAKNSGNGPAETSTPQQGHEFSLYTPNLEIEQDSQYALEFSLAPSQYSHTDMFYDYYIWTYSFLNPNFTSTKKIK